MAARDNINEMERLKSQMYSMLKSSPSEYSPKSQDLSNGSSVDTAFLLGSADLELDENGILIVRNNFSKNDDDLMIAEHNTSSHNENTILKENIEKERLHRKHCEEQIYDLQNKLLQCQEELAISISSERKKHVMLEQLDKNLASIVEGWKKQDVAKNDLIDQLRQENNNLKSYQDKQSSISQQFGVKSVEALPKKQEKSNIMKKENNELNIKEKFKIIEKEKKHLQEEKEILQKQVEILKLELSFSNSKFDAMKTKQDSAVRAKLEREIDELMKTQHNEFEKQQQQFQKEIEARNEDFTKLQAKFNQNLQIMKKENNNLREKCISLEQLQEEKEILQKEVETLKLELSFFNSKFDAMKTQQDSALRAKLEKEINEVTKTQHNEIKKQQQQFQNELEARNKDVAKLQAEFHQNLQIMKKENNNLQEKCIFLETQREDLINGLKHIMKQQWQDIISLFNQHNKNQEPTMFETNPINQMSSTMRSDIQTDKYERMSNIQNTANENFNNFQQNQMILENQITSSEINERKMKYIDETNFRNEAAPNRKNYNSKFIDKQLPLSNNTSQNFGNEIYYDAISRFEYNTNKLCNEQANSIPKFSKLHFPSSQSNSCAAEKPFQSNLEHEIESSRLKINLDHKNIPQISHPMTEIQSLNLYQTKHQYNDKNAFPNFTLKSGEHNMKSSNVCELNHNSEDILKNDRENKKYKSPLHEQSEKQIQLTHFIERLLQKSPGEPLEEILLDNSSKENQQSIAEDVERVLNEGTPKQKEKTKSAFTKSVLKESSKLDILSAKEDLSLAEVQQLLEQQQIKFTGEQVKQLLRLVYPKSSKPSSSHQNDVFERLHPSIGTNCTNAQTTENICKTKSSCRNVLSKGAMKKAMKDKSVKTSWK